MRSDYSIVEKGKGTEGHGPLPDWEYAKPNSMIALMPAYSATVAHSSASLVEHLRSPINCPCFYGNGGNPFACPGEFQRLFPANATFQCCLSKFIPHSLFDRETRPYL